MRGNSMSSVFQRYAMTAAVSAALMILFASEVSAQAPRKHTRQGDALEKIAVEEFGQLSVAERKLMRGASARETQWIGASQDPADPSNDPAHPEKWGDDRTIRSGVLAWVVSDPEAAPFIHPSGVGIAGAKIAGKLDLSYQAVARPLTLIRCAIPDGIDFSYASIASLDLRASITGMVFGDFSRVKSDLAMQFGSYGTVSIYRATIGGNLDFSAAHLTGSGAAETVSAQEASIGGDAIFHQDFTTDGLLDFRLAKIGRSLSINHAHFIGASENGLDAERIAVAGPFYWVAVEHTPHTQLDLENAAAASLFDDRASWPASGNLDIEGFTYGTFGGDSPPDSADRLQWLRLQAPGYRPQPYMELADALKQSGRSEGAIEVLIAQRIAQRHSGRMSFPARMWNLLLDSTIGYGYRPLRALWWIGGFVLLGTILFERGYRAGVMTPTDAAAFESYARNGKPPAHYPHFNAFVYSLENFLPVVDLHLGNHWHPNVYHRIRHNKSDAERNLVGKTRIGTLLRWYLWFHILAGWVITPLLFAGLSGLIRAE
jgi:hypothetical protein